MLCEACDSLLKKNQFSFERNANSWLNVIREHPVFLNSYKVVYCKNDIIFFINSIKLLCKHIVIGIVKFLNAIWRYYFLQDKITYDKRVFENVFVSHFLNESFSDHDKDFYFFELPEKIEKRKQSSLQLYINFTSKNSKKINIKWSNRKVVSKLLPKYLSLFQELKIRFLLLRESIYILRSKTSSKFEKRVKVQAAISSLSSATHSNYRLAFYFKNI